MKLIRTAALVVIALSSVLALNYQRQRTYGATFWDAYIRRTL